MLLLHLPHVTLARNKNCHSQNCHTCNFCIIIPPYANKVNYAILLVKSKEIEYYSLHYPAFEPIVQVLSTPWTDSTLVLSAKVNCRPWVLEKWPVNLGSPQVTNHFWRPPESLESNSITCHPLDQSLTVYYHDLNCHTYLYTRRLCTECQIIVAFIYIIIIIPTLT